jgi:hypothetical protein
MTRSNLIAFLITLFAFGFLVPYGKGLDFLDPVLIAICCTIPLVFVSPMVATNASTTPVRTRMVNATLFASVLSVLIAVNSLLTVNVTRRLGHVLLPSTGLLAGVLLFDIAAAAFLAIVTALLLHRMPPQRARRVVRFAFFALLLLYVFLFRFAPEGLREVFDRSLTTDILTRNAFILAAILLTADAVFWRRAGRTQPL